MYGNYGGYSNPNSNTFSTVPGSNNSTATTTTTSTTTLDPVTLSPNNITAMWVKNLSSKLLMEAQTSLSVRVPISP